MGPAMQFEYKNALTDLDQRTPEYFRREIFAHGDLTARKRALEALKGINVDRRSCRVLREIYKLSD